MSIGNNSLSNLHIFVIRKCRAIKHNVGKATIDTITTKLIAVSVIQVESNRNS